MIITREAAEKMNKETLAELASKYASEFAHRLGHNGDVVIKPAEVVFDKRDARNQLLATYNPRKYPKSLREFAKFKYDGLKKDIDESSPFVLGGVAFIPIKPLNDDARDLIEMVSPQSVREIGFFERLINRVCPSKEDYALLYGFGGEVGHITGHKIYKNEAKGGLGEALDIGSSLFELLNDVRFIGEQTKSSKDLDAVFRELYLDNLSFNRQAVSFVETMLFGGVEAMQQQIVAVKKYDKRQATLASLMFKRDYILTSHYDGAKLFLEVYDSVGGNLDKTYLQLGSILAHPKVTNIETALAEVGYSPERLSKYAGLFENTITQRCERAIKIK
ncbi:MAG: hypothetical protein WCI72_05025 [archaeon]